MPRNHSTVVGIFAFVSAQETVNRRRFNRNELRIMERASTEKSE